MELKTCDVLLFKPSSNGSMGFFERSICAITNSKYCHVGVLLEAGYKNTVAQAYTEGFWIGDYGSELQDLILKGKCDVYRVKYGLEKSQETALTTFCTDIKGKPYDWGDIISIAIYRLTGKKVILGNPNMYICSEAIDLAFTHAGINLCPEIESSLVSPGDIARSEELVMVS